MTTSGRLQHSLATRLKFRHLTLLLALEKQRSVSRVAAEMNLSQPAVTKALHEVEEIFLAPLFIRARRGLEPTATGSAVLAHARLVMADTEALGHELTAIEAGLHGRLRLGVIPYVSTAVLDAVCAHCLEQTPAVSVLVHEGTTDELVAALRAHEIDCAIARIYCSPGEDIVQTQLYAEEPTIVVHAAAARRLSASALDWGKLAGLDWILPRTTRQSGARSIRCSPRPARLRRSRSWRRSRSRPWPRCCACGHGQSPSCLAAWQRSWWHEAVPCYLTRCSGICLPWEQSGYAARSIGGH
ncbi:LysR family transcriptional regulator [Cupriavidus basilensis]